MFLACVSVLHIECGTRSEGAPDSYFPFNTLSFAGRL